VFNINNVIINHLSAELARVRAKKPTSAFSFWFIMQLYTCDNSYEIFIVFSMF